MAEERDIKYSNKDFANLKQQLINYSKSYFPDTYNDFSSTSPGMLFMEQAAYVGDLMSFYQDIQLQETFLEYAQEKENLYNLAYLMGYRPKTVGLASTDVDLFQRVPAKTVSGKQAPDFEYALVLEPNTTVASSDATKVSFYIPESVDFSYSSSASPTQVSVYATQDNGGTIEITEFLLRKTVKAYAGDIETLTISVGAAEKFFTSTINKGDKEIAGILQVEDSDTNNWKEVPYLAQDSIFTSTTNTGVDSGVVPFNLELQNVPRRFVTRHDTSGNLILQFGSKVGSTDNSVFTPDPSKIGDSNYGGISSIDIAYDPTNLSYTDAYGLAPSNTTLTITYVTGYGIEGNVRANTLTNITSVTKSYKGGLATGLTYFNSLAANNPIAAQGGKDGDTPEEIRQNALASFSAQKRAVTRADYSVRALTLPSKYGTIAKSYTSQNQTTEGLGGNPLALSMYVLAYDNNKRLVPATTTLKENLRKYLSEYKMLSDALDIRDAYIVNIEVNYEVVVLPEYNGREVLLQVQEAVKSFFDTNKWTINQPIEISKLYTAIDRVKGVQSAENIEIKNKVGGQYSDIAYDIQVATKKNVIYPSYDPMIFEVKFPDRDIVGRITTI